MDRKWTRIAALAGALAPSFASATLLIDDGGTHVFASSIGQSVTLDNGSTLRITSGGSVTGDGSSTAPGVPGYARGAIEAGFGSNSHIYLEGNSVVSAGTARVGVSRILAGELHVGGNSVVNAGLIGNTALYAFGLTSPPAPSPLKTFLSDHAVINGHVQSDGFISISGNALINGNLLEAHAGMALEMDGGLITGRVQNASLVDHTVQIRGGSILGGYGGTASSLDFSMSGGTLEGGWNARSNNMNVEIKGGQIGGGMNFGRFADPTTAASNVNIFGGSIDAALDGWLFDFTAGFDLGGYSSLDCSSNGSQFNLWGGQLGSTSAGNGIRMDLCASIDVYGTNLSYSSGWLTGLLADGSLLNVAVTEGDLWGGQLRLHDVSVPGPGTLGLLGMALGAMAMARRRRSGTRIGRAT